MFADKFPGPRAFQPADDQWEKNAALQSELEVRSYHLLDSAAIRHFPHRYELFHPESDTNRPQTAQLVMRRLFAGENSNSPLFVAIHKQTKEKLGALQCRQVQADDRWTLQYLASSDPATPDNPTPIALLEHAIAESGQCGARRLMARSEVDSPLSGALRATGFTAFAHESVFASPVVPIGESSRSVRFQENSDVWGIHQLYLQTTPRDVQNAEAFTSHVWDADFEGRSRRGWLISEGNGPVVYARVQTTRKLHKLDAMFRPDAYHRLPTLLDSVFAVLRNESPRPIFVSVRGYQQEMEATLAEFGLEPEAEQLMMVRYTTVPASARPAEVFELLPATERSTRRVPSFYVRDTHE